MVNSNIKYIVGVDEAGRGPLAGPVSLAALAIRVEDEALLKNDRIRDSKQLSEKAREKKLAELKVLRKNGKVRYAVSLVGSKFIDQKGIVAAVKKGIWNVLSRLKLEAETTLVLLDGGIKAPHTFKNQKTIIRGDATVPVIAHASIVAKVTRDRKMKKFALSFPEYGFEIHKGYGTTAHIAKIKKHGLSKIHRKTFLKKYL
jgi:ribonuclease HII